MSKFVLFSECNLGRAWWPKETKTRLLIVGTFQIYISTYVVKMSIRSSMHVLRLVAKEKILVTDRPENLWTFQNSSWWTVAGGLVTVAVEEVTHGKLSSGLRGTGLPLVAAMAGTLLRSVYWFFMLWIQKTHLEETTSHDALLTPTCYLKRLLRLYVTLT